MMDSLHNSNIGKGTLSQSIEVRQPRTSYLKSHPSRQGMQITNWPVNIVSTSDVNNDLNNSNENLQLQAENFYSPRSKRATQLDSSRSIDNGTRQTNTATGRRVTSHSRRNIQGLKNKEAPSARVLSKSRQNIL